MENLDLCPLISGNGTSDPMWREQSRQGVYGNRVF